MRTPDDPTPALNGVSNRKGMDPAFLTRAQYVLDRPVGPSSFRQVIVVADIDDRPAAAQTLRTERTRMSQLLADIRGAHETQAPAEPAGIAGNGDDPA